MYIYFIFIYCLSFCYVYLLYITFIYIYIFFTIYVCCFEVCFVHSLFFGLHSLTPNQPLTLLCRLASDWHSPLSQMATPSLRMRTAWCRSRRSSEPTTPPSRGPMTGEAPPLFGQAGLSGATIALAKGDLKRIRGNPGPSPCPPSSSHQCEGIFGHDNEMDSREGDIVQYCTSSKREKNKEKRCWTSISLCCSCVSSRRDEHCACIFTHKSVVWSSSLFSFSLSGGVAVCLKKLRI